ncbi:hypothetical protein METBIDRAFT_33322 [Metschnikowia bicuspidata var. bicuspidata NRRL YB-4993]|uniref:Protein transport protein SEC31 n=1 Tax=Metschnikowia bicuspidata var. bicuspidata NRRL YB-4993 TaxID=869754 RepID=A0A1A0H6H8_9ASCO|nr:hypothetical protein METBIDRAFT_33322 [Metschnikowia bicuspidata var. bicuspidata NRRL YB-4993]OBA19689.1 hypothetical protein METBIDRAFT_33322 [Metschnikowia bicuspidata var. bicuspidata NRRL YB-4993]
MKIKEIHSTATFAWSADVVPLLATGSAAGAVDAAFSSAASLEIWDVSGPLDAPLFAASVDHKFRALAWLPPFAAHARGVLVGALDSGAVLFWDAATLLGGAPLAAASIHASDRLLGAARCLLFNPHQPHVMASGGLHGELLVWDLLTFAPPVAPGKPTAPMDEILCVAWNNAVGHILASTSSAGYTSIWDLNARREVLHLTYAGASGRADFSHVAWHPTQLTKLITASQSDACPWLMAWDLRNASEPEAVLRGHTKGVLALDWCAQDPALLLSAGKDNRTRLWNPLSGAHLADYPAAGNWAFLTRFAPRAPDVFATASFDGKVVVRTSQETAAPPPDRAAAASDDDFWGAIAAEEPSRAVVELSQAPGWLKRPCTASFGFGLKLVSVSTSQGKSAVSVSPLPTANAEHGFSKALASAISTNDFRALLAARLESPTCDAADWEVLLELQKRGKSHFLQAFLEEDCDGPASPPEKPADDFVSTPADNEDSFFASLSKDFQTQKTLDQKPPYVPAGQFKIIDELLSSGDSRLTKLLLANNITDAVSVCLEEGKLMEALVLALNQDDNVKRKVKSHFFEQTKDGVLSRLIYSASSKDIVDIVSNADISNWKEIAASIASYCTEEADFNSKVVELGDRILASGTSDNEKRRNALMCYLAGNALDKVSSIWLTGLPDLEHLILTSKNANISSPHDARYLALAGFVEKISVYRSLSNITGPLAGPSIEPVCKAVFDFANMAAANGDFELATQYLSLLPDDFAGLKLEKERIVKATSMAPDPVRQSTGSGIPKSQNRYINTRAASNVPPQPPFAKPAAAGRPYLQAAPAMSNPLLGTAQAFAPAAAPTFAAPANPYVPAGAEKRGSFGGYNFTPQNNTLGISSSPSVVPPPGQIRPPSTPAFTQTLQPTQGAQTAVAPPSSTGSKYKPETEGWNDLPETFKASKPVSRRVPAPSPSLSVTQTPQTQPPKRPQASHSIAPPPKAGSRSVSKTSVPGTPRIASSPRPSKYAPTIPPSPALQPNGMNLTNMSSPIAPPKASAPPINPYAPAVVPSAKTTYATPPMNNFVAPPTAGISRNATQIVNPYSPNARQGLRSVSNGSIGGPTSQGIVPPMPRIPSASARQTPVKPAESHFAPPQKLGNGRYSSPQVGHSNGNGTFAPPPVAPISNIASPVAPTSHVAPPPAALVSSVAPPPVAPTSHIAPPPIGLGSNVAPPSSSGSRQAVPPPMAVSGNAAQPPAATPPTANKEGNPKDPNNEAREFIKSSFGTILGQIKPAAPPKYAKHVLDMEKRLGILFDHLSRQTLLSAQTIELLNDVAKSLNDKDYPKATASHQRIGQEYSAEAGDWHTGVKRLVTMAEAFEI